MSEDVLVNDHRMDEAGEPVTLQQPLTAGQMIKEARTKAGLHIAALAVTLKVPVKRLEALENDDMVSLPEPVFLRALASSVCRTLNVDDVPILALLPKAGTTRLDSRHDSINAPIKSAIGQDNENPLTVLKTPWMLGALLLVASAALIIFWPKSWSLGSLNPPVSRVNESVSKTVSESVLPAPENAVIEVKNAPLPPISPASSAINNVANTEVNTVTNANDIVLFKATGETWVEVKNAQGSTAFKKLLNSGETASVTGELPLTVTIGNADVTQVEVRGKPLDLVAVSKNNVARFEVK